MATNLRNREIDAHRTSIEFTIQGVVNYLKDALGQSLVAIIAGVTERTVADWASNSTRSPRPDADRRLRTALHVFQLLQQEDSPHTVRAWFVGLNPQLDDLSPARALQEDRLEDVIVAARAFATGA